MPPSGRASRRGEIALLFGWNFAAVTAFFVGRTVRDALFLAHESPARLPWLYIASPIVVVCVGLIYSRYADRFRRDRLIIATCLTFAALVALTRLGLGPRWLYYALYAGVEVMGALAMMQFWLTAGERFNPREAKRWFGVIAAGGTAANIAVGLAITVVARATGAEDLLWVVVGALLVVAVCAIALRDAPAAGRPALGRAATASGPVPGTSHLAVLGPMIACALLAVTLVDFQFKAITTAVYDGDRVEMVRFFAILSAVTGAAALLVQLTLTSRLLGRFGVAGALLLLPTTLSLGAVALLLLPSLAAAAAAKGADTTLRYTVNDAGMQLLYLPVPRAVRTRKKAFLDTVVRPASEATVGAALLLYGTFTDALRPLAIATVVVGAVWIALVLRMRGAYLISLGETLRRRRVVASAVDSYEAAREVAVAARAALASTDRGEVLRGLDLARLAPEALRADVTPLASAADPEVRAAALRALPDPLPHEALDDPSPEVRAIAARRASGSRLVRVRPLLDGPQSVAVAAAAALHERGDAADRAVARDAIAAMLVHGDPRRRRLGLDAAAELRDPAWVDALIGRLGDTHDGLRAARALGALGEHAEPALLACLAPGGDARVAAGALRALGVIGSPRAASALLDPFHPSAAAAPEIVRDAACVALREAAAGGASLDVAGVVAACRSEITFAFTAMAAAEGLGRAESTLAPDGTRTAVPFAPDSEVGPAALISRALRERHERAAGRVLDLLAAVDPALEVDTARLNLREPEATRRGNAVELLDARRWARPIAPLRSLVLALIDESPRARKLALAERELTLPRRDRDAWVAALLADPNPWMAACAAYYAGAAAVLAAREDLQALAARTDALVSATARAALARLDDPTGEASMLTIADKVLFLKGMDLFAQLPSEDLADLAALTEELALEPGERLFAEGDRGDALYLVVEGRVRATFGGVTLSELGPREVLGEMALIDPAPRSASVDVVVPARLLRLGGDDFANLLAERPEVSAGVLRVLTRRLRAATGRNVGG